MQTFNVTKRDHLVVDYSNNMSYEAFERLVKLYMFTKVFDKLARRSTEKICCG